MSPGRLLRQRTVVPLALLLLAVAETTGAAATSLATIALSALGLLCAVAGIRRHRPEGRLWHVLAGAIAVQGIAVVVWHGHPLLGLPYPGPGVADVGWIVANALLAGTLLYILTGRERPLTVLLDTVAIGAGVGLVAGVAIIGPKLVAGDVSLGQSTIPSAYALVDVVLLSSVLRLLMAPRGGPPALWLLALAASGTVASDVLWNWLTLSGDYVPGAWTDIGWLGLPVLVGLAAMHPSMRVVRRRQNRYDDELRVIGAALLGAAGLVSPLLLGLHDVLPVLPGLDHPGTSGIAVMTTGALVSGLVVTRFAVLLRHARVLADTADAALDERTRLLADSTARHRRLLDQLPAVVLVYELAAGGELPRPIYVGGQVAQLLGIPAEDWLHRTAETYARIHPDDRAQGRRMLEAAATFHRVLAAEFRFTRPDGTEIWLRAASAVIDEIDGVRALQAILFDVTDVKRAEQERERLAAELSQRQKLEAVGQLAAGVAHEINTPIQFVGDTVRFLRDGFSDMLALSFVRAELRGAAETGTVSEELLARVREAEDAADIEYLHERVPAALDRADEGIARSRASSMRCASSRTRPAPATRPPTSTTRCATPWSWPPAPTSTSRTSRPTSPTYRGSCATSATSTRSSSTSSSTPPRRSRTRSATPVGAGGSPSPAAGIAIRWS